MVESDTVFKGFHLLEKRSVYKQASQKEYIHSSIPLRHTGLNSEGHSSELIEYVE